MTDQHKELAIKFLKEVAEQRNVDLIEGIFHPDYDSRTVIDDKKDRLLDSSVFNFYRDQDVAIKSGIDAMKARTTLFNNLVESEWYIKSILADEDTVMIKFLVKFTHIGKFMGFPPTNQTVELLGFYHFLFKDNRIINIDLMLDYLKFLQKIGLAIIQENDTEKINAYLENLRKLNIIPA